MRALDIRSAVVPLRLVFWGGLICVFDFKINGFDILNDVVGSIMVTIGVFRLGDIEVNDRYSKAMLYAKIIAILCILRAFHSQFTYPVPMVISFLLLVLGLATMVAIVVFCIAMRWFCEEAALRESVRSWRVTTVLFALVYMIPLGLLYLASLAANVTGASFHFNLPGPIALVFIAVLFIPLIHLFISTSRMKNEAQSVPDTDLAAS